MPPIPVPTLLAYIGVLLIIVGVLLVIAGFDIPPVRQLTIAPGKTTLVVGFIVVFIGILLLQPGITSAFTPAPIPPAFVAITVLPSTLTSTGTATSSPTTTPISLETPTPPPADTPAPSATTSTPPNTETPAVTLSDTPTSTDTPAPVNEVDPTNLAEIFPQVGDGDDFSLFEPAANSEFVFFTSRACSHSGEVGLQADYNIRNPAVARWGLEWESSPLTYFDASAFTKLVLWVRGQTGQEQYLIISLKDQALAEGQEIKLVDPGMRIESTDWMKVEIPLSAFTEVNLAQLTHITILTIYEENGTGGVCIDDISLE